MRGSWSCRCSWVMVVVALLMITTAMAGAQEEIRYEGGPEGVVWAVQLSDLHVSVYHPDRAEDLENLAGKALALVKPAIVLITGDLTDAKNRERTVTRQDEAEWIQYRESMRSVVQQSGLPQHAFFDLRGNHDKFGVPYANSKLDFFSRYSISAEMNRTDLVQSVTVTANGGWNYLFAGFDDTLSIGLRGPTNLFGHPTDSMLSTMDSELGRLDKHPSDHQAKVVFGHFPMSFTASSESGRRPEEVLAKHGVAAYICGHLHTKFGKQLYRLHSYSNKVNSRRSEFWEWEMGDWRGSRMMRILALDHGHASFVDISLDRDSNSTTIVLPTYPLDSRFMKKKPAYVGFDEDDGADSIRALVFSREPVVHVVAKIFDSRSGAQLLADELEMHPVFAHRDRAVLYKTAWRRNRYSDPSPLRYWLEISVTDSLGRQAVTELRPFSVDGKVARQRWGLSEFLVMGVQWADAYPALFWLNIGLILGAQLLVPKLLCLYLERRKIYKNFVLSILSSNPSDKSRFQRVIRVPIWVSMEGCRNAGLWWAQVLYITYLLIFPWFWGLPSAESFSTGYMTYRGWQIQGIQQGSGIGVPDVIVIVLPYLYMVLLPLTLIIAFMSAERAACEVHAALLECSKKKEESTVAAGDHGYDARKRVNVIADSGLLQLLETEMQPLHTNSREKKSCRICGRWMRKALLGACLLVGCLHWRQCYWVAAAYGPKAVLASPGFAWSVPLFIAFTVYETSSIRERPAWR